MWNGTLNRRLIAALCCAVALVACTTHPTANHHANVDEAEAAASGGGFAGSGHSMWASDSGQGNGVLIGSGHEDQTVGDTTGRGGGIIESGH
jgi:uncharacterized membrane protein